MPAFTRGTPSRTRVLAANGGVESALSVGLETHKRQYFRPSPDACLIGPSCAIASVTPEGATLWSRRKAPSTCATRSPWCSAPRDKVRLIWVEGRAVTATTAPTTPPPTRR